MLYYESFTHNYGEVQMEWTRSPITILKQNITLPDYVLVEFKASSIHRARLIVSYFLNKMFSCILLDFGTNWLPLLSLPGCTASMCFKLVVV